MLNPEDLSQSISLVQQSPINTAGVSDWRLYHSEDRCMCTTETNDLYPTEKWCLTTTNHSSVEVMAFEKVNKTDDCSTKWLYYPCKYSLHSCLACG